MNPLYLKRGKIMKSTLVWYILWSGAVESYESFGESVVSSSGQVVLEDEDANVRKGREKMRVRTDQRNTTRGQSGTGDEKKYFEKRRKQARKKMWGRLVLGDEG
jgi:hypothetical protein